jgi:hypothetical protein
MSIFNRGRNPNATVGIFLLLLMAVLVSPNVLPRFASDLFPEFVYSGVPCTWLRRADSRAFHQSLLGRTVAVPFEISVDSTTLPADGSGFLVIRITLRNNSLGTVPFVYDVTENQVPIIDNGTSGLGVLFTPNNSLSGSFQRQNQGATIPETSMRMLGPRQSCVHTFQIPGGNVLTDPALTSGTATVRAFYRGAVRGQTIAPTPLPGSPIATPIFADQGLWVGYIESDPVTITRGLPAGS